jgi:hypothetical protein
VFEAGGASQDFPQTVGRHKEIVAQTDGGMIPIAEPDASQKDKRKGKTLSWREAKICLRAQGSQTPAVSVSNRPGNSTPTTGIAACCARLTTGHAAALPSPAMNVRRFIESPRRR